MNSKKCTQCGAVKPLNQFNRMTQARDGYRSECKQCRKQTREGVSTRRIMAEEWPHFRALLGPVEARERLMKAMDLTLHEFQGVTRGMISEEDRKAFERQSELNRYHFPQTA